MDEIRLKDELLTKLSMQLDNETLQLVDGALYSVLRDYDVSKKTTELSTDIVRFPELEMFIAKLKFDNSSKVPCTNIRSSCWIC